MTNVNTIDPKHLTDQHLLAEYRELPRIASHFSHNPRVPIPEKYKLGTGHIKFFYNKAHYLIQRHEAIMDELMVRRFNLTKTASFDFAPMFTTFVLIKQQGWKPEIRDHRINIQQIMERIKANPGKYTMVGESLHSIRDYELQLKRIYLG